MKEGGKRSKVRKGGTTREPEFGVMHMEDGGRGHNARSVDETKDGNGLETDPTLKPIEGTQPF